MPYVTRVFAGALATVVLLVSRSGYSAEETTKSLLTVDAEATSASAPLRSGLRGHGEFQPRVTSTTLPRNQASQALRSTETIVLATWNGGQLTNTELSASLQMRRPRSVSDMSFQQILFLPATRQREVVKDMVYELIIYQKAKAEGINEESPPIADTLKDYRHQVLARLFYQREVEPQLAQLDEKNARLYYERNKELYVTPARTIVEDLHLSGYREYTAKAGDTPDKLLENTDDKTSAPRILHGNPPFHPRFPLTAGNDVPMLPIREGEPLLVPLSTEDMTSKTKLAQEIRRRALAGEDFNALISKYSEHGRLAPSPRPFAMEGSPASPLIKAAVTRTRDTSVSEVLRTPYGLEIFFILDRTTTQTIPFDALREQLVTQVTSDTEAVKTTVEAKRSEVIARLAKKYSLQLNEEALKRKDYGGEDPLTGATPIASGENFSYTLDEFLHDLQATGKTWQNMTAEQRTEFVRNAPAVAAYLIERAALDAGLDKTPKFEEEMHSKAVLEISSEYLQNKLHKQVSRASDADLRAYYEAHLDKYTSPSQVVLREISKRINLALPPDRKVAAIEEAKKVLSDIRAKLRSQPDFEQFARRESEAISTRSRGGLIGRVADNFRGEMFRHQIEALKPGQTTEPFLYGNEVMIIRLDERTPPVTPAFEEILPRIRQDYLREVPKKKTEEFKDSILEEAGFKLQF